MKILGIETSTILCGIAIVEDKKFLGEYSINIGNFHDEKLMMMISNLLRTINISSNQIDCISVSSGPGSFTGLRIGISVAKGLAISINKPIIGVPTLDSIAHSFFDLSGSMSTKSIQLCPVLDAKRDEVYYALYKYDDTEMIRCTDYRCDSIAMIMENLTYPTIFIGEATKKFKNSPSIDKNVIIYSGLENNDPKSIAYLGYKRMLLGQYEDIDSFEPIYVKEFKPKLK